MGVEAKAVMEERVVAWITALLGQAGALEEQRDPDWRHAYGLAQGAGFILRNRQWPQFPSTSGSSFLRLVSEERDRRARGEGPRAPEPINDPLTPLAAPDDDDDEAQSSPHEGSAEQLMKGLVKQVQSFGPQDPAWRHAFGLAQGVGVMLSNGRWSIYPPVEGTVFTRLMGDEQAGRGGAAPAPTAAPVAPTAPRPPAPPLPPRPRPGQTGGFTKPTPPAPPSPPRPPAPPTPRPAAPRPPAPPAPDAFRAMPTLMNEGEGADAEEAEDPGFRAQRTMLEAASDDMDDAAPPAAAPGSAMTMLQGEEDDAPPPATPPRQAGPALPSSAMPTFLQAEDDEEEAPPPPPSVARSTSQPTLLTNDEDSSSSSERTQVSASRGGSGSAGHGASTVPGDDSGRLPAPRMGPGTAPPPPVKPHRDPATGALRRGPPPSMREAMAGKQAQPQRRKEEAAEAEQLEKIGKFDILSRLGKGAMGQVFKGRGPDGAIVAIKVLHQHLGTSKRVRARFMREAKAVERIQHPNVVRFVETGEQPGVGQYIVMEFVDGKPLHDVLKDRKGAKFELAQATDLLLQTCRGLKAAHAAGVVHRDLKPENILLSNNGEMKITDFSLARREQDSMLLTRPGQVMGTPHFMSPEQAKGQAVDVRTDLYSLGALMYVLLTGQFPFPNGTVAEVIAAHCEKPRPDPRALNPEVDEPLANVCLKLMAIDRNDRFPTVEALIEELHSILGIADDKDDDVAGALPPGSRVDEYTVERVLGAGGMGAVYRARSAQNEPVALKVLPQQAGRDPQERVKDVRRFLNEAKLAKRVTSPHVYKVFKYGVDDGGQAFMAASLAEGVALREYVSKNGPLKPDQVLKVARGVCTALQAIHGAEVMHRDITPANIILGPDWQTKKDAAVCIIDFGLAIPLDKEKGGGPAEPTALFKHRVATKKDDDVDEEALYLDDLPGGTPAYMAPEVLEDPSLVDERADLYGLGSTLYFASTGHAPYSGDGIEAVLYQQKSQPPAPITQFNADFPEELSELIIQLLAHEPHTRPRSAKLCLSKLQRLEDPKATSMAWRPDQQAVAMVEAPAAPPAGFQWATFILGFVTGTVVMAGAAFAMQLL